MNKLFIAALVSIISTSAIATGNEGGKRKPVSNTPSQNITADSRSAALAFANSASTSNSTSYNNPSAYGQAVASGGQAVSGGTSSGVNFQITTPYGAPDFTLGNVYPTAPCMGSSQIGGSGVGFSVGVGTSWTDHECGKRETARSFAAIGLKDDALAILCSSEYAAVAPICKTIGISKDSASK